MRKLIVLEVLDSETDVIGLIGPAMVCAYIGGVYNDIINNHINLYI
jgi:hypothetical protein